VQIDAPISLPTIGPNAHEHRNKLRAERYQLYLLVEALGQFRQKIYKCQACLIYELC
jgi:hypothetical protein